eukprot:562754-Rhodomonas_salina.1
MDAALVQSGPKPVAAPLRPGVTVLHDDASDDDQIFHADSDAADNNSIAFPTTSGTTAFALQGSDGGVVSRR